MYYEINVSLNGTHFFATAERSITDKTKLKIVHRELTQRFPESDGFSITTSVNHKAGRYLAMHEIYE